VEDGDVVAQVADGGVGREAPHQEHVQGRGLGRNAEGFGQGGVDLLDVGPHDGCGALDPGAHRRQLPGQGRAPLGRAVLGAKAGDEIVVEAPKGAWSAKVISIS
jgi:hypothetical protein